jgi:Ca2+-binding EF-hand superfamily protein
MTQQPLTKQEEAERASFVQFFDAADKDNDGFLSFDEFRNTILKDNFKGTEMDILVNMI